MTEPRADWQTQPRVTRAELAADLRRLGLGPGDACLVHSSLSRLGCVVGGASAVVDALLDAVSPGGTVLFPTFTGTKQDGPECPPVFDVRSSPCWTGRIPETARLAPGALRSLEATHSVAALGPGARHYTAGHELSLTPCDEHSPFYRLIAEGGWILLLGASQESNTTLHCLEELAGVPYHLQDALTACTVIDYAGIRHTCPARLHLWRWQRDFARIDEPLRAAGELRVGQVGQATARLMSAQRLAEILLPLLRDDPLYLLSDEARRELQGGG